MKIIILNNSILFIRLNLTTNSAKSCLWYFVSWTAFKRYSHEFKIGEVTISNVKRFYEVLELDLNKRYRL